jgi:superfamily II DNA/RNA helicase
MLDLGFLPDVEKIFSMVASRRHTMLFSATMPGPVVALARRYMVQPTHIRASEPDDHSHVVRSITQRVYRAHAMDKVEMLSRMLQARERGLTMIFARTKRTAAKVADELGERGFAAAAIHGDLGQGAREQALRAFRNGKVDVLVATDVAARGIDVDDVTHVVNYQCPEDEKTYVHRIGRTGRAGKKGIAVTFVDWDDMPRWGLIDKVLGLGIPEPVETYSSSEHLFAELDIPADATGRLPRSQRTRAGLDAEQVEDLGETGKKHGGTSGRGRRERDRTRDGDRRPRGSGRDRDDQPSGADGEAPPARRRARRRTRGGKPLVAEPGSLETPAPDPAPGGAEAGEAKRRRRRRRGGRSIGAGAAE